MKHDVNTSDQRTITHLFRERGRVELTVRDLAAGNIDWISYSQPQYHININHFQKIYKLK